MFFTRIPTHLTFFAFSSNSLSPCCEGSTLYVGNAGDSRAVIGRRNRAIVITNDHRMSNKAEEERVVESGGTFCPDGFLNGELAVTRALGDWHLEDIKAPSPAPDALGHLENAAATRMALSNIPEVCGTRFLFFLLLFC